MAGARFAMNLVEQDASSLEFWTVTGIVMASAMGASLVSTLPILVAIFRPRSPLFGIIGIGAYATTVTAITLAVIWFFDPFFLETEVVFGLSTMIMVFAATLTTPLYLARLCGIQLKWGRETIAELSPSSPRPEESLPPQVRPLG